MRSRDIFPWLACFLVCLLTACGGEVEPQPDEEVSAQETVEVIPEFRDQDAARILALEDEIATTYRRDPKDSALIPLLAERASLLEVKALALEAESAQVALARDGIVKARSQRLKNSKIKLQEHIEELSRAPAGSFAAAQYMAFLKRKNGENQ